MQFLQEILKLDFVNILRAGTGGLTILCVLIVAYSTIRPGLDIARIKMLMWFTGIIFTICVVSTMYLDISIGVERISNLELERTRYRTERDSLKSLNSELQQARSQLEPYRSTVEQLRSKFCENSSFHCNTNLARNSTKTSWRTMTLYESALCGIICD